MKTLIKISAVVVALLLALGIVSSYTVRKRK